MGLKEVQSQQAKCFESQTKINQRKIGGIVSVFNLHFWQQNRKFAFKIKRVFFIMAAIFSQHINLFDLNFAEFNFKLFAYILAILSLKLSKFVLSAIDLSCPVEHSGLRDFLRFYQAFGMILVSYLFFSLYDNPSPIKVLFLVY